MIEAWIYNVESYFQLNIIPRKYWVKAVIGFFHQTHFEELREFRKLPYKEFKKEIIAMYNRPDLSHSKITELLQTHQKSDETA